MRMAALETKYSGVIHFNLDMILTYKVLTKDTADLEENIGLGIVDMGSHGYYMLTKESTEKLNFLIEQAGGPYYKV